MEEALKIIGSVLFWAVIVFVGIVLAYVIFLVVSALFINRKKEYKTKSRFYENLLNLSTFLATKLCGIKVVVTGREKIPDGRFLFVCNHRSNFDPIIARFVLHKQDVAFISKPSNFKIPIAGHLIVRCRFLAIDRENPRNSMKTLVKAIEYIKEDQGSIGIYPEGTRSKEGKLLPYHDGVFKIAQKANVPVLVGVMTGTEQIKKRAPFRRAVVHFDILGAITFENGENSHDVAEKARKMTLDCIYEREGGKYELNEENAPNKTTENTEKTE